MVEKRILSAVLAIVVFMTMFTMPVVAGEADINKKADILNTLKILKGDGTDYNLGGQLRRSEAAAFIVRMMGKEEHVSQNKAQYVQTPFSDVPEDKWYAHYVGFCWKNGIIGGFSDGTYRPDDFVSEKAFLKLVLGAMGYKQNVDFTWDQVYQKAYELGIVTDKSYVSKTVDDLQYKRQGVVDVLYNALSKIEKAGKRTLLERMRDEGAINDELLNTAAVQLNQYGANVFIPSSPVSVFTKDDIDYLGINFSGTPEEIADKIYQWQVENIAYQAGGPDFADVSDPMRWNYFLPGIYPTNKMIREMRKDGKIYGICYQYATIYYSIARYYGLECRVTAMKEKPSELDPTIDKRTTTGLSMEEYNRLKLKLQEKGLDYSYESIRQVASETSAHYRAEVKLNGEWVVKDATVPFTGGTYNKLYNFYEVDWLEGYKPEKLAASGNVQADNAGGASSSLIDIIKALTGEKLETQPLDLQHLDLQHLYLQYLDLLK